MVDPHHHIRRVTVKHKAAAHMQGVMEFSTTWIFTSKVLNAVTAEVGSTMSVAAIATIAL
jgi:hypothetical protein